MGRLGMRFGIESAKLADALDIRSKGKRRIDQLDRQLVVSFMRWERQEETFGSIWEKMFVRYLLDF